MIDFDAAVRLIGARAGTQLVAIDGLPVSGKSTLAARLEAKLGARTVYLDDFVRPRTEWRDKVGPAFPFPYIRYEQFSQTVITLAQGQVARYRPYDWATGQPAENWTEIDPDGLVVIEGVSALNAELAPLYDLRIWVESDGATTLAAALTRGVGDSEREWRELFMPSVALYLASDPQQRADYRVSGRGALPG